MNIKISDVMSVSRGLHILQEERKEGNLKNEGISKAYILNYSDVAEYIYKDVDTIEENIKENKEEIFVNLNKKFRNSRLQEFDIILKVKAIEFRPKITFWRNRDREMNYIYSNDLIFIRKISEQIEPKFLFYLMQTNRIKQILKNKAKNNNNKIKCSDIENIEFNLVSIKEQIEIVNQIEAYKNKLENLIK